MAVVAHEDHARIWRALGGQDAHIEIIQRRLERIENMLREMDIRLQDLRREMDDIDRGSSDA